MLAAVMALTAPALSYAQQVLELEKIARLEERPLITGFERRHLIDAGGDASCLVCGQEKARNCAACEVVSYCSVEHQAVDSPWHAEVCEVLREHADDEALRPTLGRLIVQLLGRARSRSPVAWSDWDDYLGHAVETAEHRLLTDAASRPLTLLYLVRALELPALVQDRALRVHVMASSAKELEGMPLYAELAVLERDVEVSFVGPELGSSAEPDARAGRVALRYHAGEYRRALWSRLGVPDLVVGFDAGLLLYRSWQPTLSDLIQSGVPFAITSYRSWEAMAEARLLTQSGASCVRPVGPNPFASRAARRSSTICNDVSWDNSYLSVWR